jgi:hypothetical protein
MVRAFLKVYMELGSYFLFLQEQKKDIIIEQIWKDQGIDAETRAFAAGFYRHNVAPEQVLLDTACSDFQDENVHNVMPKSHAEVSSKLMDDSCDDSDFN